MHHPPLTQHKNTHPLHARSLASTRTPAHTHTHTHTQTHTHTHLLAVARPTTPIVARPATVPLPPKNGKPAKKQKKAVGHPRETPTDKHTSTSSHAPRTTHHAPRTTHHAPRTTPTPTHTELGARIFWQALFHPSPPQTL